MKTVVYPVILMTENTLYFSEELAREVEDKVKKLNSNCSVIVTVEKCFLYEDREEIPILNPPKSL